MWAKRLCSPGRFESVEVPAPRDGPADGDVLLRTLAGGVCGSDAPKFQGMKEAALDARGGFLPGRPGFPLHEIVGEVVTSTRGDFRPGDRVVGWARGTVGLAEFVVTGAQDVARYDPCWAPEDAVILQPLACVLSALERVPVDGRRVAVLGLGPIGALFAHVARAQGARHVVGVDPVERSELRARGVVDDVVAVRADQWVATVEDRERPDVVIEAVGHQVETLDNAITVCQVGGTVVCFGIPDQDVYPVNLEQVMRKNLALIGGITRDHRGSLVRADTYLSAHPHLVRALITHRFGRDEATTAFEMAFEPARGRLKVVLTLGQ